MLLICSSENPEYSREVLRLRYVTKWNNNFLLTLNLVLFLLRQLGQSSYFSVKESEVKQNINPSYLAVFKALY